MTEFTFEDLKKETKTFIDLIDKEDGKEKDYLNQQL